uniref:Uncharacterized protein n=1 Tax=Oryza nivara TaxID=4536 RepID=A0A0E0FZG4_ORYNI
MPPKHRGSSRRPPPPSGKNMPAIGASEKKTTPNLRRLAVSTINDIVDVSAGIDSTTPKGRRFAVLGELDDDDDDVMDSCVPGLSGLSGPSQEKAAPHNKQAKKKKTWVPPRRKKSFRFSKALNSPADQDDDTEQDYSVPVAIATECNDATMEKNVEEANLLTQELNELGLGEDISTDKFRGYLRQLPQEQDSPVDISTQLDFNQLDAQNELHELYRVKYYKSLQQVSGTRSKLDHDEMINQYPFDMSKQLEEVLICFENDGTLDSVDDEVLWEVLKCFDYIFVWYFHPEYCKLAALVDYQRLVIKNDGCMYANWDKYHMYFNTYDVEKQYVKYYGELSKKLKWGRVSNRGLYQAVKIATGFPKITAKLAYLGFHEFVSSMNYDVCFFKELDDVYFEIWQRVTKQKMSFRDAMKEVYELNRFPVRQQKMKYVLEINDCSQWEAEVAEDQVLGLIADAVKKLRDKPRFYDDYIKKKINIAQAIGLITTEEA